MRPVARPMFHFEYPAEVSYFFQGEIPEDWGEAADRMSEVNGYCKKDLYLEALMDQQTRGQ